MNPSSKIGLAVIVFLVACTSAPEVTQLPLAKQVETATPTMKPRLTSTLRPIETHTSIPTATFTPWPTKEVLAQFGVFGGDGGWEYFAFTGGNMSKWVLYTDGHFVVQKEDNSGFWFEQTTFTVPQMCSFLSQVEEAGFFNLAFDNSSESEMGIPTANPIYQFDNTTQFSEGGSQYVLQVNGSHSRQIIIYSSYVQYLVPEAYQVFNLFANYSPPSQLTVYQPQYLLLRIEKGSDEVNPAVMQAWPDDLASLEMLATENVETAASAFDKHVSQVLVKNEQVKPIVEAFDDRFGYKSFQSGDQMYYVAARPFLPHETLNEFSEFPEVNEFALPFRCSN